MQIWKNCLVASAKFQRKYLIWNLTFVDIWKCASVVEDFSLFPCLSKTQYDYAINVMTWYVLIPIYFFRSSYSADRTNMFLVNDGVFRKHACTACRFSQLCISPENFLKIYLLQLKFLLPEMKSVGEQNLKNRKIGSRCT